MNYGLLAVARCSRSKRAPFPLNDPLNPSHVQGACNGAEALHAFQKIGQILKLELAYHASKFSGEYL